MTAATKGRESMNETPDEFSPPIETNPLGSKATIRFKGRNEARSWAQREAQLWSNIRDKAAAFECPEVIALLDDPLQSITAASTKELVEARKEIEALMKGYETGRYISTSSDFARAVFAIGNSNGSLRVGMIAGVFQLPIPETIIQKRPGDLLSFLTGYAAGVSRHHIAVGEVPRAKDELRQTTKKMADALKEFDARRKELDEAATAQMNKFATELDAANARHTEMLTTHRTEIDQLQENHAAALAEMERKYQERFSLRAPKDYWNAKADAHATAARKALKTFAWIGAGIVGVVIVGAVTATYVKQFDFGADLVHFFARKEFATAIVTACIALPSLGVIWLLRHISRLYVTNLQLGEDARLRQVMVETFLALNEKEKAVSDAERLLILQALFRPASGSGDDDSQHTLTDHILKRLDPKAGG